MGVESRRYTDIVGWIWIALFAGAVAVLAAAEWPRLSARVGWEGRRTRARERQKAQFTLLRGEDDDSDEFAASVERDLAKLPTTNERDRDLS